MHLVLFPVRFPLLPLDLGPVRGVEVSLVACPVRASTLLSPRLLRELGRGELLVCSGRPLPALLPRLPFPAHHSTLCEVMSRESLRRSAPVHDPPVFPDLRTEEQGRIVEPVLGRPALMTGLVDLAPAPLPARGQAVESIVDGTRLIRCPPACGRGGIDRGLLTAIGRVAFALARCLGEIGRGLRTATDLVGITLSGAGRDLRVATGLGGSIHDPLLVGESSGHAIPLSALETARNHEHGRLSPLAIRVQGIEADEPDVRNGRVWRRLLFPRLPLSRKRRPQWPLLLRGVL